MLFRMCDITGVEGTGKRRFLVNNYYNDISQSVAHSFLRVIKKVFLCLQNNY